MPKHLLRTVAALVVVILLADAGRAQLLPPGLLPGQRGGEEAQAPNDGTRGERSGGDAQADAQAPAPGTSDATQGGTGTGPATHTRALIEVLRDETARRRLIDELEATATAAEAQAQTQSGTPRAEPAGPADTAAPPGDAAPADGDAAAPEGNAAPADGDAAAPAEGNAAPADGGAAGAAAGATPTPPIGERITEAVPGFFRQALKDSQEVFNELRATVRRMHGFTALDVGELRRILLGIAPVAAAAVAAYAVARRFALVLVRRLAARLDPSRIVRNGLIALTALAIDLGTVLVGVGAGLVALALNGFEDETLTTFRVLFLIAFGVSGSFIVAIRAILSPKLASLRLLPMSAREARYWARHLGIVVILIAFGELLIRSLVTETVSPITARATLVTIHVFLGLYVIWLVIANRRGPPAFFEARAAQNDDDLTYSILAYLLRFWHIIAVAFLLTLMHEVITTRNGALPLVLAATEVVAAFVVGAFLITLITQLGEQGVRVPSRIQRSLPALEDRVNAIYPSFLRLFRLLILVLWIAYTLEAVGLVNISAWLEQRVGVDVLGAVASVLVIALFAFGAWLVLSSWVDYRLAPRRGHAPTARERTLLSLLRNAATVVILVVGLMLTLSELGISIAPLLASAGVLGLALGFGAQKMVEDIIGGVFIQFENAVNVGDVVQAANVTGVVEQLTIRSIGLRDLHGVYHVVPFSAVSTVSNFTKGFGHHVADIRVAYRENIDRAKTEMLAAYDDLRKDPELGPKLIGDMEWFGVEMLGDSSIVLRARLKCWPGEQWALGRAYNEYVKNRFDAAGIEIPYPHMTMKFEGGQQGNAVPTEIVSPKPKRRPVPRPRAAPIRADSPTDADSDADAPDGDGGFR